MTRPLRVAFIPTNVTGVNFYRMRQPADAMKALGVETAVLWYKDDQYLVEGWENDLLDEKHGPKIMTDIAHACDWADAVVWGGLHAGQSLRLFLYLRGQYDKVFLTEMDDYVFSTPEANAASAHFAPGSDLVKTFHTQIRASDGMIVSTPYLKSLYDDFSPSVRVVENAVNLALWRRTSPSPGRQRVTIGWVGGGSHTEDLALVKDAMFNVLNKHPNVWFKVLHGIPDFFKGTHPRIITDKDFKPINHYPAWVSRAKFDIGIAPLVDNNFNRGKSNLRWLEYSAMGIPCVASSLPHFTGSIVHGETGLIARNAQDFEKQLSALVESESFRKTLGANAHNEVNRNWSPRVMAEKYKATIEEMLYAKSDEGNARIAHRRPNGRPEQHTLVRV